MHLALQPDLTAVLQNRARCAVCRDCLVTPPQDKKFFIRGKRAAVHCQGKPALSPQALERPHQTAQRGLPQCCRFPLQRRMAATRAGAEELAGHQRIAAGCDGFRPMAGWAGVGDRLGADGHGRRLQDSRTESFDSCSQA